MTEGKAIQKAAELSVSYGEMAVVFLKANGDYGAFLYNDYLGDDGAVVSRYIDGKLVGV